MCARPIFIQRGSLLGIPLGDIIREVWVFIAVLVIALLVMIFVPETVLWLPHVFGYRGG